MAALLGLGGAIVGGVLVLLGDAVRRTAQRRRDDVLRLSEASVAYAVVMGRLFARDRDARDRGEAPGDDRAERHEVSLRFFMTPGSEELYPAAMAVVQAQRGHARLPLDAGGPEVEAAAEAYFVAQRDLEARVRAVVRRGRIGLAVEPERIRVPGG